jgi:hypothetical protein
MKQTEYVGVVEKDGHLSLPESVRDQLRLQPEQVLRVTIVVTGADDGDAGAALECWHSLGQEARPGCLREASARHDDYLYGGNR